MRDGDDVAARALEVALDNTPFLNLGYLRPLLDYAVLYQIAESLNPAYTRLLEAELRRRRQEFIVGPSKAVR